MAMTRSLEVCRGTLVKQEGTYGTNPTTAGGTDDLRIYSATLPITPAFEILPNNHGREQLARIHTGITQHKFADVRLPTRFTPTGTLGDWTADNNAAAQYSLWCAAGCTVLGDTTPASESITIAPVKKANIDTIDATGPTDSPGLVGPIWVEAHTEAYRYTASGVRGNVTLSGTAGGPLGLEFAGRGYYGTPDGTTVDGMVEDPLPAAWTGGTENTHFLKGFSAGTITPTAGSAYTPILQSFQLQTGNAVSFVGDVNAAGGGLFRINGRAPSLTLTMILDEDTGSNLSAADIYEDMDDRVTHAISLVQDMDTVETFTFTASQAVLRGVSTGSSNAMRTLTATYDLLGTTTDGDEWSITVTPT